MEQQVNGFGSTYNSGVGLGSINNNSYSNNNGNSNANSLQFYTMSKLKNDTGGDEVNSLTGMGGGGTGVGVGIPGKSGNKMFNNLNYSNYNYNLSEISKANISQVPNFNYANNINNNHHNNSNSHHNHPPSLAFSPSSSSMNNNIPRKSPFNISETSNQFGGRNESNVGGNVTVTAMQGKPGGNDDFSQAVGSGGFENVPLGPMSTPFPQNGTSRIQTGNGLLSSIGDSINQTDSQHGGKTSSFSSLTSLIKLLNPSFFWTTGQDGSSSSSSSGYGGTANQQGGNDDDYDDILNEPPLLEELGIDPANIAKYLKCVIMFKSIKEYSGSNNISMKEDGSNNNQIEWDMAGPILLIACLGFFLLLAGKIHFGYIYGIGILSCIGTYILLNIMSSSQSIDLYTTMSILGYSLLPIVILAGISVIFSLRTKFGIIMAIFFNMWSTITASRFFEYTVSLKHQRYLIAYPIALLYASFTIVTIF
ncbi:Yip1p like integral membrane [Cryptosporidium sp. chipmunk genotype I]|uniref:Yip1p like integral membrane n=1 Tax=Cryptosporidium sp. chipmunk genotype I TaxID=1280935 RepID=UPI00351A9757|nr:Yip1p like integral membrane [Cryptosporidium sp. chipmunk genotype I]